MKKITLLLCACFLFTLSFSSCKEECKSCSAEVTTTVGGAATPGSSSKDAQEFCGDALEAIENNLERTETSEILGVETVTTTTYTCN